MVEWQYTGFSFSHPGLGQTKPRFMFQCMNGSDRREERQCLIHSLISCHASTQRTATVRRADAGGRQRWRTVPSLYFTCRMQAGLLATARLSESLLQVLLHADMSKKTKARFLSSSPRPWPEARSGNLALCSGKICIQSCPFPTQ